MQLNCCGAASPHDYRHSAWFNRSRPASLVFVPQSCCLDSQSTGGATRRSPPPPGEVGTNTQCQLEAILYPLHPSYSTASRKPYSLRTQVTLHFAIFTEWANRNRACFTRYNYYAMCSSVFHFLVIFSSFYFVSWLN